MSDERSTKVVKNAISAKAKCFECGRVFDLMDEDDAGEWYYGHDCEG
jgi:hypothetical protein